MNQVRDQADYQDRNQTPEGYAPLIMGRTYIHCPILTSSFETKLIKLSRICFKRVWCHGCVSRALMQALDSHDSADPRAF